MEQNRNLTDGNETHLVKRTASIYGVEGGSHILVNVALKYLHSLLLPLEGSI